jgi:hypothetical protein
MYAKRYKAELAADWQQTTRCKIGRYKQVFLVLADRDSFFKNL